MTIWSFNIKFRWLFAGLWTWRAVSIPGQYTWELYWMKWHWERFQSHHFSVPLSAAFH